MSFPTLASVCSGIGGAELAFHGLAEPVLMAEIAPFPRAVLQHRFPNVPLRDDFTALIEAPPLVDILTGGTPCQAFSVAGRRLSLEDARGNLTLAFVLLFDAIDAARRDAGLKPAVCLWENVPGVLSTKDNAFGCFLGALAGNDSPLEPPAKGKWSKSGLVVGPTRKVAWRVTDSQFFGLAQRRRRLFVVAGSGDGFDPSKVLFEPEGVQRHTPPSRSQGKAVAALTANGVGTCGADDNQGQAGHLIAEILASAGPLPFDTTQLTNSLNRSDPQPGDPCHPLAAQAHPPAIAYVVEQEPEEDIYPPRLARWMADHASIGADEDDYEVLFGDPYGDVRASIQAPSWELDDGPLEAYCPELAPTITANYFKNGGIPAGKDCVPTGLIATQAAVAFGGNNTSGPIEVATALSAHGGACGRMDFESETFLVETQCVTGSITHALKAEGADASEDGTGRGNPIIPVHAFDARQSDVIQYGDLTGPLDTDGHSVGLQQGLAVRRLTPMECERLQGLPDNFTMIPWKRKAPEDCPDGPRYKAIGNGWAIPNIRWIARRLVAELDNARKHVD